MSHLEVLWDGIRLPIVGDPEFVGVRQRYAHERFVPMMGRFTASGKVWLYDQARMDALIWKFERKAARRARQNARRLARRATRKSR